MPRFPPAFLSLLVALASLVALSGCYDSYVYGGDAGRGIDGSIPDGGLSCSSELCADEAPCCPNCPGEPDFCGDPLLGCPVPLCLPDAGLPPPSSCPDGMECGPGAQCCPGCDGDFICWPDGEVCVPLPCPPPRSCDPLGGGECDPDEFCDIDIGSVCGIFGDIGICTQRPVGCPDIWAPVCGCDLMEYGNECEANALGTSVAFEGGCFDIFP